MSSTEIVQMATNIRYLFCVLLCLSGSLNAVLWSSKNCNPNGDDRTVVKGKVTDAICCGATHMTMAHSKCNILEKNSCDAEDTCKWHDPGRNIKCRTAYNRLLPECLERPSCKLNRDSRNNVCCKNPDLEKVDNCVNLMAGRCPSAWQVPRDCCPAPNDKYAHMLTTDHTRTDLVCCNAPCTAIEQAWRGVEGNATVGVSPVPGKAHCKADGAQMPAAVRENCAPAKRSLLASLMGGGGGNYGLGGLGGLGGGGLDSSMISQLLGLPVGEGESYDLGKVIPGMAGNTGLDGGATLAALQGLGFGSSKESHVDEIIVDGFNFIDPKKFINRIYGSPFGLANAQAMFGMQYGIPMNKFKKHTGFHQIMTGYSNPYGPPPPSPHATQPPSYHPPTPSPYDPQPPSYHPPTPPPYTPPVYPGPIPEHHPENVAESVPYPSSQHYPDPSPQHYPEPYPQPYPQPEHQQPVYEPYPQQYPESYPEHQPYDPHPYPPQPEHVPHQPEPAHYEPYPEQAPVNYPAYPEPSHDPYYPPQPAHDPYYPAQPQHDPHYPPQPSYPQQDPYSPPPPPQQHYPEQVPYPPQNQYGSNPNPVPGYGHVPAHGHGGPPPPSAAVHGPPATPPTAATAAPALDPTDNDPTD